MDAQLHLSRSPPLRVRATGASARDPPSPQKWPPLGKFALSRRTRLAKGIPPTAALITPPRPPKSQWHWIGNPPTCRVPFGEIPMHRDRSGLTGGLQVRALPLEPMLLSFSPNNLH